jgi:hypothetical protein
MLFIEVLLEGCTFGGKLSIRLSKEDATELSSRRLLEEHSKYLK